MLDEPSAGLDPIVAAELDELILFLKEIFRSALLLSPMSSIVLSALPTGSRCCSMEGSSQSAQKTKHAQTSIHA